MNSESSIGKTNILMPEETASFCAQIALILKAGIPLYEGMDVIRDNYKGTRNQKEFEKICEDVCRDGSFYEAVKASGLFPSFMLHMVKIGDMAGRLDIVMEGLKRYYDSESRQKQEMKRALFYPLCMCFIMAAIIGVLLVKVMPVFEDVFRSIGVELSTVSGGAVSFGIWLARIVLVLFLIIGVFALVIFILLHTKYKEQTISLCFRLVPVTKRIGDQINASRLCSALSMFLKSGLGVSDGLSYSVNLMSTETAMGRLKKALDKSMENVPFSELALEIGWFDRLHIQTMRAAEAAGRLDEILEDLGTDYEERAQSSMAGAMAVVEPVMVGVISVLIGGILLAVMLPLISLLSGLS